MLRANEGLKLSVELAAILYEAAWQMAEHGYFFAKKLGL